MEFHEEAAMPYDPDSGRLSLARAKTEKLLANAPGVIGFGETVAPDGREAIIVYVKDAEILSQLPDDVDGTSLIGEVTGEIDAY